MTIYDELQRKAAEILTRHGLLDEPVQVRAHALTPEEAIGNPDRDDFPIQIGTRRYGALIEPAGMTASAVAWAELLVVTGTTLVNGTLPDFVGTKPLILYGTTIAGAAQLKGWERFCACGS